MYNASQNLHESWRRCATDERIIHPEYQQILEARMQALGLSKRKREVIWHLIAGMSTEEIAEALYIMPKTVKDHVSQAYTRLGIISESDSPRRIHIVLFLLGLDTTALRAELKRKESERV